MTYAEAIQKIEDHCKYLKQLSDESIKSTNDLCDLMEKQTFTDDQHSTLQTLLFVSIAKVMKP